MEKVSHYKVSGTTGPELYASIGERGPLVGQSRTIAHTNFRLTWSRDYQRRGNDCVLASARPNLTITYTLPKASEKLAQPVRGNWERFAAGIAEHEKVHGDHIKDMVAEIVRVSVGLTVAADPECRTIRTVLTQRLSEISQAQRRRSRDFDRVEMSDGGNIHQLILQLVNGG